ncbi:MAG: zinc ABC transporter substrate-binding protein [Tepidanaerobacteraceae bacterium]|nr:zinc ABC transporter substrate-binding protein [Tepidanaerobacteraceae bacterium]
MKITFKSITIMLITIANILLMTSCSSHTDETNSKLVVAVSIIPQETFVKEVAGNMVDIVTIIPPGKSPANYAPTPQELEKLSNASIYFTIGVPAEQSSILPKLKEINSNVQIVDISEKVRNYYPDREFSLGQKDPHIWLSPKRAVIMVECIAYELSTIDSKNRDFYLKNAQNYIVKLKELDKDIKNLSHKLKNKTFIIYHPSLGYFADDYGLDMIPIQSEGKDATPDNLQKVIDTAKKQGIKTVLYQAEIDSKQSRLIASEIGGKAVQIVPLDPNYIDNLKKIAAIISGSAK